MIFSSLFLFKLCVIPALIAVVSYAQKRWGHSIGGMIGGLPLVAGPISIFLAVEQGLPFARAAAPETAAALLGTSAYALTYMHLAQSRPWYFCWICGMGACLSVFYLQSLLQISPVFQIVLGILAMAINTIFISRIPPKPHIHPAGTSWDIPIRAVAVLIPLLLITGLAHIIGPKYSGMFSSFPVFWTVLFIMTQIQWGYDALITFFRGAVIGNYSMVVFTAAIAFIPVDNIPALYFIAIAVTAGTAYFFNRHKAFFLKMRV
ncbi:MAG: hypothetical protein WDO70_10405 [Alphaproteobacteria bacterium]